MIFIPKTEVCSCCDVGYHEKTTKTTMSFNVGEEKNTPPENKHDNLEENNHE